jgi:hypothetical protein
VLSLFCKYVNAALLCSCGWHGMLCMVVLVTVGFLKMLYVNLDFPLFILIPKSLIYYYVQIPL